eukprot:756078-Pelagomonas_calceolata.AAC.6
MGQVCAWDGRCLPVEMQAPPAPAAAQVKGGAPVDDVALAVPLDLCFSFLLLGVAQGRIDLHFSWVLANLVMSFSVSSIPLVFGHKLPSGAASQGHFNSPSEHARAESESGRLGRTGLQGNPTHVSHTVLACNAQSK